MMLRTLTTLLALCGLAVAACVSEQDPRPPKPAPEKPVPEEPAPEEPAPRQGGAKPDRPAPDDPTKKSAREVLTELLAKEGITIDSEGKRVLCEGKITVTKDFLEFVAIGPNGKKHEALVTLRCRGSSLNAALLALGIEPGKNADFVEIVPQPTREEYEAGAPLDRLIAPTGPELSLTVSWHDENEKLIAKPVEALIIDITTEKALENARWIFFKSLVAPIEKGKPPVFVADFEGNFISTYYAKPDSHMITIVHERARDDQNWYANTEALPPSGTPCTLTLAVKAAPKGEAKAPSK